jgi:hypothetical protein
MVSRRKENQVSLTAGPKNSDSPLAVLSKGRPSTGWSASARSPTLAITARRHASLLVS